MTASQNTPPKKSEFTIGNAASIITTLVASGTILVSIAMAYGELKTKDAMHDLKISQIETKVEQAEVRARTDHDLLIDIRADLKALRDVLERLLRGQRADAQNGQPIPAIGRP